MIVNDAMNIRTYTYDQIPEIYDNMCMDIFGHIDPVHHPSTILVGTVDDKVIGMMSVYVHDKVSVYIQLSGVMSDNKGSVHTLKWLREAVKYLHQRAIHVMAAISNTNSGAIRLALKAGFIITGTRLAPDGSLLVEMICTRGIDNGTI